MATQIDTRGGVAAPADETAAWIWGTVPAIAVWSTVCSQLAPATELGEMGSG